MASRKPSLTVAISPAARSELRAIYAYNAEHRGSTQADAYEDFLLDGIALLATAYGDGKPVQHFPKLQGITLKRATRGHGHVVIYRVDQAEQIVRVLHVYHTAQDIPGRLRKEPQ